MLRLGLRACLGAARAPGVTRTVRPLAAAAGIQAAREAGSGEAYGAFDESQEQAGVTEEEAEEWAFGQRPELEHSAAASQPAGPGCIKDPAADASADLRYYSQEAGQGNQGTGGGGEQKAKDANTEELADKVAAEKAAGGDEEFLPEFEQEERHPHREPEFEPAVRERKVAAAEKLALEESEP